MSVCMMSFLYANMVCVYPTEPILLKNRFYISQNKPLLWQKFHKLLFICEKRAVSSIWGRNLKIGVRGANYHLTMKPLT